MKFGNLDNNLDQILYTFMRIIPIENRVISKFSVSEKMGILR